MNPSVLQLISKKIMLMIMTLVFICCNGIEDENNTKIDIADLKEGVHAAFYNSKGNKIAVSTTKGRIFLLDSTLNVLNYKKIKEGRANSSFFSIDDQYVISGGQDKILTVIDANSMEVVESYNFGFNSYTSVYGNHTLGGCGEDGKLILYNKISGDTIFQVLDPMGAHHLYYIRPDTSVVVSSGLSGYEYDITNKKIRYVYSGHNDIVYCIMPSHNEQAIVTASKDGFVRVFDRFSAKLLYKSLKLDGDVYVACFSPDDQVVVASTSEGSIYFMDKNLSKLIFKIDAFKTRINTIHYSPCGTMLLAGSEGGGVKIFSSDTGNQLYSLDVFSL